MNVSTIKKAFYNCMTSFKGYPIGETNEGIQYMICIFNYYIKHNDTFKDKRKKKYEVELFRENIDKILNCLPELKHDISEYDIMNEKSEDSNIYELFLPRLNPIVLHKKEASSYEKKFIIQKLIHDFVQNQEPLLNHLSGYKSVNSFFYDDNKGPYALFRTTNKESKLYKLQSILPQLEEVIRFQKCNLSYYKTNTKTDPYAYKYKRENDVYFSFFKHCKKLNIPIPNNVESLDDVKELFEEAYSQKINLINPTEKKEETKPIDIDKLNELLAFERTKHTKYEKIYKEIFSIKKNKKVNLFEDETIEHYCYMNNILWGIIIDILFYLPSKINQKLNYKDFNELICKSWKIDQSHYKDIKDIILNNSFKSINDTINIDAFEKYRTIVNDMPHIENLEFKFNLYDNLLFMIYISTLSNVAFNKEIKTYYNSYINHLDMDHKEIHKKNEKDKRTEKKQITDKFRDMREEEREIEYELKLNKLGDWSIGLDKSIYKYSKDKYKSDVEDISQMVMNDESIYEELNPNEIEDPNGMEEEDKFEEHNNFEEEE
jgi:hypothetical protein